MSKYELKDAVDEHMPYIDEILNEEKIPIFDRYMKAGLLFVDIAISESSFSSKKDLLKSEVFFKRIVPLVNDWYFSKYGELARNPKNKVYSGIINPYGQPVLVRIPSTTKKVEVPGETVWLTFPDRLHESESLTDMIQTTLMMDRLSLEEKEVLLAEFSDIVSKTRSINLNLMSASELDEETKNMAHGIWSHFEKAILDILSFQDQIASIGCWELHLAIEKTLKVYLKQAEEKKYYGHDLSKLGKRVRNYNSDIDLSTIESLPSDKVAIQLRYSEIISSVYDVVDYYKNALDLCATVTSRLKKRYILNNMAILLKRPPWAK